VTLAGPDLPGAEILDEQVQNLYDSLYVKLAGYPDHLEVFPAHGEGSLCGRGMSAKKSSTLGYERRANPMLRFPSFEAFKKEVMSAFPVRPKSFSHIIQTNLKGAATLDACPMDKSLTPKQFEEMVADGAIIIDARDSAAFGGFHIPGSINIGFEKQLANWVGMVVDPNAELLLVVDDREDYDRMMTELHRIGYDLIFGYLSGGIMAWLMSGRAVDQLEQISPHQLAGRLEKSGMRVIDVRTPAEWNASRIKWAEHLPLSDILADQLPDAQKDEELVLQCGSGYRSNIAASILRQAGYSHVSNPWPAACLPGPMRVFPDFNLKAAPSRLAPGDTRLFETWPGQGSTGHVSLFVVDPLQRPIPGLPLCSLEVAFRRLNDGHVSSAII
jgi:hydroxyacylglutathione hydrolase